MTPGHQTPGKLRQMPIARPFWLDGQLLLVRPSFVAVTTVHLVHRSQSRDHALGATQPFRQTADPAGETQEWRFNPTSRIWTRRSLRPFIS